MYIYFDYKNQEAETGDYVIRTLLKQLLLCSDLIPPDLEKIYDECRSRQKSPEGSFFTQQLLSTAASFASIHILLDALDECTSRTLEDAIALIHQLKDPDPHIKWFCTFRPILIDLGERLNIPTIHSIDAHNEDLMNYLSIRLNKEWRHSKTLRERVIEPLVKNAHGKSVSFCMLIRH